MFGGASRGSRRTTRFRGQDFNAELHLKLSDVYRSQKQTLTVNGKNIRLTIPAGVENGQTIKIKGYGGEGVQGGPNGDLFITFAITNDTSFKREGKDL
ncbi:DnaJ C-terminal domain-containing protein, partial [Longispora fulva]|uniref:DnaJ C-terminal domain-containing protein n=3 Tax=Bacteria TaxID=2 RepID=UPI0036438779